MTQKIQNKSYVMALFSKVAYLQPEKAEITFKEYGFHNYKFIENDGAQCYIVNNEDTIIIIFRGTEPKQWSDIKADIKAYKKQGIHKHGKVHAGFKDEVDKIYGEICHKLEQITNQMYDHEVHLTGHSLGGAMATICAKRLNEDIDTVNSLYTFGSPRVGNRRWCKSLQVPHYRFQNNNDIVCKVPFWIMGYRHHGKNVYINYKGKIRKMRMWRRFLDGMRGRLRAWSKFQLFDGIYDHDISTYSKRVNNVVLGD